MSESTELIVIVRIAVPMNRVRKIVSTCLSTKISKHSTANEFRNAIRDASVLCTQKKLGTAVPTLPDRRTFAFGRRFSSKSEANARTGLGSHPCCWLICIHGSHLHERAARSTNVFSGACLATSAETFIIIQVGITATIGLVGTLKYCKERISRRTIRVGIFISLGRPSGVFCFAAMALISPKVELIITNIIEIALIQIGLAIELLLLRFFAKFFCTAVILLAKPLSATGIFCMASPFAVPSDNRSIIAVYGNVYPLLVYNAFLSDRGYFPF